MTTYNGSKPCSSACGEAMLCSCCTLVLAAHRFRGRIPGFLRHPASDRRWRRSHPKRNFKKKKKTHIYIYKDSVTGPSFPSLCKCGNTNKRPSGHFQLHPRFKSWVGGWVPLRGRSGKRSSLLRQRFGHRPFFSISLQVRDHEQKAIRPLPTPPITSHNFSHKG